jgi:protein-S-isoprenylcysteine O-methyltransferase Ste14
MELPARLAAIAFARLQQSPAYDAVMRLPLLGWSVFAATAQMAALARYLREAGPAPSWSVWAVGVSMRAATITFFLLLAAAMILRARPTERARGIEPRVSAFLGTCLTCAISLFPRRDLSATAETLAMSLTFLGSAGAAAALLRLGRSFSMMAEARDLVTKGPYRFVRHPLYLAEEIAIVGLWMQFLSLATTIVFALQIAFQFRRMHNEERLLAARFREYAAYQQQTARLLPGIY